MTTPFILPSYTTEIVEKEYEFRNMLHNSEMIIHQRGGTVSGAYSSGYVVDRWIAENSSDKIITFSKSIDAPTGFAASVRAIIATGASVHEFDIITLRQKLEFNNITGLNYGETVQNGSYLSFWVKSSVAGKYSIYLSSATSAATFNTPYFVNEANTWERKSIYIPPPPNGLFTGWQGELDIHGMSLDFIFAAGEYWTTESSLFDDPSYGVVAENSWNEAYAVSGPGIAYPFSANGAIFSVTGVQWEVGDTSTAYQKVPISLETQNCQRYFYKASGDLFFRRIGHGQAISTTQAQILTHFPTEMRAVPALSVGTIAGQYQLVGPTGNSLICSAVPVSITGSTKYIGMSRFTVSSGLTAGHATQALSLESDAVLNWSAEL